MDPVSAVLIGATLLAGGAAARSASNAGKAQSIQLKEQAKQDATAAKDREIERRRSLIESIATQNAEAGAGGDDITTGSRRAIVLEDIRRERMDDLTDRAMTGRRGVTLRAAGRAAKSNANLQAGATLLDSGARAAQSS